MVQVHQLLKLAFSEVDQFQGLDHKSQATSMLTICTPSEKPKRYKTSNFQNRHRLRKQHLFFFPFLILHPHLFQILFSQPCYPTQFPQNLVQSSFATAKGQLSYWLALWSLPLQMAIASHAAPTAKGQLPYWWALWSLPLHVRPQLLMQHPLPHLP